MPVDRRIAHRTILWIIDIDGLRRHTLAHQSGRLYSIGRDALVNAKLIMLRCRKIVHAPFPSSRT